MNMIAQILMLFYVLDGAAPTPAVRHLAIGIQTMAPRPVPLHTAHRLASEAIEVTQDERYRWLRPVDLLALAAVESDFRVSLVAENGKPDPKGWDCGISGVRVTIYHGRSRRARRLCRRIAESTALSFEYSARELTNNRQRYCKKWRGIGKPWMLKRCIYNVYKAGPRYSKASKYWIRHHCYRMGILLGRRPRRWRDSCRRAQSLHWIWKVFR